MRRNLLALGLLLALIALASKSSPPAPPSIDWEASFWLHEPNGFGAEWLDIEDARYKICGSGCTSASVFERGHVQRTANQLLLTSDDGSNRSYELIQRKSGKALRDSKGKVLPEKDAGVPRLHPAPELLRSDIPLELDGIRPGLSRAEVLHIFPRASPDSDGALAVYPYPASDYNKVTISMGGDDKVQLINGVRLSQAGHPLLNECSTRREIDWLFGPRRWKTQTGDSLGTSATTRYGKLEIQVHGLVGMTPAEAGLISLRLFR